MKALQCILGYSTLQKAVVLDAVDAPRRRDPPVKLVEQDVARNCGRLMTRASFVDVVDRPHYCNSPLATLPLRPPRKVLATSC